MKLKNDEVYKQSENEVWELHNFGNDFDESI